MFEPAKGRWSLAGGFVEENESLDEAASRILRKLTGLGVCLSEAVISLMGKQTEIRATE